MTCEPRLHIIQLRRIEVGHRTDGAVMIGMARGEEILENLVAQQAERLVVALALLILDDAALVIELFLRHRAEQMPHPIAFRSEEHTSELQSLMRISYAVFCLKKKQSRLHLSDN